MWAVGLFARHSSPLKLDPHRPWDSETLSTQFAVQKPTSKRENETLHVLLVRWLAVENCLPKRTHHGMMECRNEAARTKCGDSPLARRSKDFFRELRRD
jgi:hypothetical protein